MVIWAAHFFYIKFQHNSFFPWRQFDVSQPVFFYLQWCHPWTVLANIWK